MPKRVSSKNAELNVDMNGESLSELEDIKPKKRSRKKSEKPIESKVDITDPSVPQVEESKPRKRSGKKSEKLPSVSKIDITDQPLPQEEDKPKKRSRKKVEKPIVSKVDITDPSVPQEENVKPKKASRKKPVVPKVDITEESLPQAEDNKPKKKSEKRRSRKTASDSSDEVIPTWKQERDLIGNSVLKSAEHSKKYLGAHVSAGGGVHNAIYNAVAIGCRSFALFLKNQRRWESKPMTQENIDLWHKAVEETNFDLKMIVPHGSYLLNAASPVQEQRERTRDCLIDEVQRCQQLGIKLYNFHPGSTTGKCSYDEGIHYIAEILDEVIEATKDVIILVETMAGQKNVIGGRFEDLKQIIDIVKPENRSRVGVCFDTCHIFVAGYEVRDKESYEKTMKKFDEVVGFKYLKAVHLNDALTKFNSCHDRHANIGRGEMEGFFPLLMNDKRFDNIPMVLETPDGFYPQEMKYLYTLDGMKAEKIKTEN